MLQRSIIDAICITVKSLTLAEAIEVLRRVNQSHLKRTMYAETSTGAHREFKFNELGDDARNQCAHLTTFWEMWYCCGPPGNRTWVESTLCQFVADCLLLEVVESGEKTVCDIVADVIKLGAP